MIFHDPLTAALIFNPSICTLQSGRVAIETLSPFAPGTTYWHPDNENSPHQVAKTVNVDGFFDEYFGVFA